MTENNKIAGLDRNIVLVLACAAFTIVIALVIALSKSSGDQLAPAPVADTEPPASTSVQQNSALVRPSFDSLRITPDGRGVIAGRMSGGAQIDLIANGEKIATEMADARGEWVIIIQQPLPPGPTEFDLQGYPAGGGDMLSAAETAFAHVPERSDGGVLTIVTDKAGAKATRVLQTPDSLGAAGALALMIETVDYGAAGGGRVIVSGRAAASASVRFYVDNDFKAAAAPNADGRWEVSFDTALSAGTHMLRADQVAGAGDVLLRAEQPIEIDQPIDLSSAKTGVVIRPGNSLWQIARSIYGKGPQYTVIFKENSEQIKDPNLIYPGQLFSLPKQPEK